MNSQFHAWCLHHNLVRPLLTGWKIPFSKFSKIFQFLRNSNPAVIFECRKTLFPTAMEFCLGFFRSFLESSVLLYHTRILSDGKTAHCEYWAFFATICISPWQMIVFIIGKEIEYFTILFNEILSKLHALLCSRSISCL